MKETEIKFLLTLRYNPLSPKEYKIQTEVPDVKEVDLALSSGIDSHYVLHTLRQEQPDLKIRCIYIGFLDEQYPEVFKAEKLAWKYNAEFNPWVINDPLHDLEKYIKIIQEPRWNLYQHFLYEQCKSKVLVTGDGGDEIFAGYTFRYKKFLETGSYMEGHIRDWVEDQLYLFNDRECPEVPEANNLDGVLKLDYNGKLKHDFLPTNSKLAKHAGIQLITPLLRHELRPWKELYDPIRNLGKLPLRKELDRWDDEKLGFGFDIVKYWNRIGREKIQPILDSKNAEIYKIINWDWYQRHKESQDVRYINKFLQLYALELFINNNAATT